MSPLVAVAPSSKAAVWPDLAGFGLADPIRFGSRKKSEIHVAFAVCGILWYGHDIEDIEGTQSWVSACSAAGGHADAWDGEG